METLNDFHQHLDELRRQVQAEADALGDLQKAFAEQAAYLRRHDQARCLDNLLSKVEQEIECVGYGEAAASSNFDDLRIKMALLGFATAGIAGLMFRLKQHPMKLGATLAYEQLSNTEPYGTIMVGVGPGGVPRDVRVFSISRYASQQGFSEAKIIAELQAKGFRLFTPRAFNDFLSSLKNEVLKGTSILPTVKPSTSIKFVPRRTQHKEASKNDN